MIPDRRAEFLRKFIQEYAVHLITDIRVVSEEGGQRYKAFLVRGRREWLLPKIFGRSFVDDLAGTKEFQGQLRELIDSALEQFLLKDEHRYALLLAALNTCDDHWPGKHATASQIKAYYERYSDGDVLFEKDLYYLSDKGLIDLYHRPTAQGALEHAKTGTPWKIVLPDYLIRLSSEPFAARILADGKDWLKRITQSPRRIYEVFISSCQEELENERIIVRKAVEDDAELCKHFKVVAFEKELTPSTGSPSVVTVAAAKRCDIYIGLFGARYGDVEADGRSPTEREYRAAAEDAEQRLGEKGVIVKCCG